MAQGARRPASAAGGRQQELCPIREPGSAREEARPDGKREEEIFRLQCAVRAYSQKVQERREELLKVERLVADKEEAVVRYRKRLGGVSAVEANDKQLHRMREILENRIKDTHAKILAVEDKNLATRKRVDAIRRQRIAFAGSMKRLRADLRAKRGDVLAKEASIAELERDFRRLSAKAVDMRAQAKIKRLEYEAELDALEEQAGSEELFDEDQAAKAASKKRRPSPPAVRKKRTQHEAEEATPSIEPAVEDAVIRRASKTLTKGDEERLKASVLRSKWSVIFDRVIKQKATKGVESFKQAFEEIKAMEGFVDLAGFVRSFKGIDEDNFARFVFVSDAETRCEELVRDISEVREQLDRAKRKVQNEDVARRKILGGVMKSIEDAKARRAALQAKITALEGTVGDYRDGISALFSAISSSLPPETLASVNERLEGGNATGNMMVYLGIIEQQIDEIINGFAVKLRKEGPALRRLSSPRNKRNGGQRRGQPTSPKSISGASASGATPTRAELVQRDPERAKMLFESITAYGGAAVPSLSTKEAYKKLNLPELSGELDLAELASDEDSRPLYFRELQDELRSRFVP